MDVRQFPEPMDTFDSVEAIMNDMEIDCLFPEIVPSLRCSTMFVEYMKDMFESDGQQSVMADAEKNNPNQLIVVGLCPWRQVPSILSSAIHTLDARLEHALKVLRRRGYVGMDMDENVQICKKMAAKEGGVFLPAVRALAMIGVAFDTRSMGLPIPDATYKRAIELTMAMTEPTLFRDTDAKWGVAILRHLDFFYVFSAFLNCVSEVCDSIREVYSNLDELQPQLSEMYREAQRLREKSNVIERLQKEKEERDGIIAKQQEDIGTMPAKITSLTNQLDGAKARIANLERQLADKQAAYDALLASQKKDTVSDVVLSDTGTVAESVPETRPLPENRILFAGGHDILVNKLKQIHPDWSYLDDDSNFNSAYCRKDVDCVFIWDKHLSHIVFRNLKSVLGHVPFYYVKSTNLDMLEQEMRRQYWDGLDKSGGDA